MKMFPSGVYTCITSYAQPLSCVHFITGFYVKTTQMQIAELNFITILTLIFHRYRFASCSVGILIYSHYFSLIFCCQDIVLFGSDINAFVHLLLGRICWITTHSKR